MKKITYFLTTVALALGAVACSETKDDNPVLIPQPAAGGYQAFLNVPELANQYLTLTKDTQDGTFDMTCSQPDYGFAAAATYSVEVSFEPFEAMSREGEEEGGEEEGLPTSVILSTTFNDCAAINIPNTELADAIVAMRGYASPDQVPSPYEPLYVRLIAQIINVDGVLIPNTDIYSNSITIKGVSLTYIPATEPGLPSGIYLRGGMNNWGNDAGFGDELKWQFLTTTEAGVYVVEDAEIPVDTEFKVADMAWGDINAGYNGSDIQINVPYTLQNGNNAGNLKCPSDFMGDVQLVVKGGNYILTLIPYEVQDPGVQSDIFLVGTMTDWQFDDPDYEFLTAKYVDNWVIEEITVPAGSQFKISKYKWGEPNCGLSNTGQEFEIGVAYTLFNNGAAGNIEMPENFTGKVNLRLKNGDYIVTFVPNVEE